MGRMKDFAIQQQERSNCITAATATSKDRTAYETQAELTGVVSGCYNARSIRRSVETDRDVMIELSGVECDGDVFFFAKFAPLGCVADGDDFQITATIYDTLDASFDGAIRDYDNLFFAAAVIGQFA